MTPRTRTAAPLIPVEAATRTRRRGPERYDVIVVGGGGAGMVAACAAADAGASVLLLERTPLLGGTTAISGGQLWLPGNPHMSALRVDDTSEEALTYLSRVTLGEVPMPLLKAFVRHAAELVRYLEHRTPVRFFVVERPDYHLGWEGAKTCGRSLEVLPYPTAELGAFADLVRFSVTRAPLTSAEGRAGVGAGLLESRRAAGIKTQGSALVAGLARACLDRGIHLRTRARVIDLQTDRGRVVGIRAATGGAAASIRAEAAVILASGGFEWSDALKRAFLKSVDTAPVSSPWNEGDGLLMAMRAGAALGNMTEAGWTAAIMIPGEEYDARRMARNVVRELALPGSIMVNPRGVRFVNEAMGYQDLGKAFHTFDPVNYRYANTPAWLVFDAGFRRRYTAATIPPAAPAPAWFHAAPTLATLARSVDVDPDGLIETVATFNRDAAEGRDREYGRGDSAHDRFNGDETHRPNPCLGPILEPPFHAVRIHLGNMGTKGGPRTDASGRVLSPSGERIPGLYACGDVSASWMGPGYPGAGGMLGPGLTAAFLSGQAAARDGG